MSAAPRMSKEDEEILRKLRETVATMEQTTTTKVNEVLQATQKLQASWARVADNVQTSKVHSLSDARAAKVVESRS